MPLFRKLSPLLMLPLLLVTLYGGQAAPAGHNSALLPVATACGITFSDVPQSNIFATYIYDLACRGVVSGVGNGAFNPGGQANRAQFAKMGALGFNLPQVNPVTPTFGDISAAHVLYPYVERAVAANAIRGYQQVGQCPGTTTPCFLPDRSISRAEVAIIVMRAGGFSLIAAPPTPTFSDVPTTYFAYREIETAASLSIISGAGGRFRPADPIRRDELCKVLSRAMAVAPARPPSPLTIFDEQLGAGWDSWSWGGNYNFANTAPVYAGSKSLAATYTEGYSGLFLHHADFNRTAYSHLRFYIHGGAQGGQRIVVHLAGSGGENGGSGRAVSDYIFPSHRIAANQWQEVVIPISDLVAGSNNNGVAGGLIFQSESDAASPAYYLDNVSLRSENYSNRPPATPTPGPAPTPIPGNLGYYRGVNLSAGEFSWIGWPGTFGKDYSYPTAAEFNYFKSRGLNLLRVPFRWERLQPTLNGPLDAGELARLDAVVGYGSSRGMYIIIEPHNFARYRLAGNDYLIGSPQVPNAAYADFWRKLAQHYANEPFLYYNIMNEPHDTGGLWPAAAQSAVNAIRTVDNNHWLLVPGDCWTGAWTWRDCNESLNITDPQDKIIYEAHQYFDDDGSGTYNESYEGEGANPNTGVDRLQPFIAWLQEHDFKGFLGEYGVPGDDPRWLTVTDNMLTRLDQVGMGATYWMAGPWLGSHPMSLEPYPNGDDKPQMATLRRHLGKQQ